MDPVDDETPPQGIFDQLGDNRIVEFMHLVRNAIAKMCGHQRTLGNCLFDSGRTGIGMTERNRDMACARLADHLKRMGLFWRESQQNDRLG